MATVKIKVRTIETPNLDHIFSLEAFRYLQLKDVISSLFGHITHIYTNLDSIDEKIRDLPDFEKLSNSKLLLTLNFRNWSNR
jgi:hypothetical protein